ncbi:tetratricopeptide repeat protein [Nonomuraea aridisoli]|uniref:tetratricopeptide repeat protein n=1 Tax=Nonomuraea aridisoli TaxID=2070368 RepID=UPI0015E8B8C3|nr:tetratricopeptide repeat protein [Nonomuraea aridisoli]
MTAGEAPDRLSQYATASGHGRIYQAGRDQYIYVGDRSEPRVVVSLPPPPARLVGREGKVDGLLDLLAPGDRGVPSIVVSAVHGLGGIGKTALAVHAAHEAVGRGWFRGGALFVSMRGYDPAGPMTGAQAVEEVLRALLGGQQLPATPEEQAVLYRSELTRRAQSGQRVLVVADDVSSPGQVLPLIPAHGAHRLLVTSRDTLASPALGARLVDLRELDPGAGAHLIADVLTRARPEDPRPTREIDALAQVAEHCGRLPLALQIAAAMLVRDPGLPIAALAAGLADERTRLDRLHHDDGGDRSLAVRATFELSYRRLPADRRRLFRLLSLNPGPDVSTEAAAALAGAPADGTRPALAALAGAGLLVEWPAGAGRWRMHDLLAVYATDLARDDDAGLREDAVARLLEHYRATASAAGVHFGALPGQPVPARFSSRDEALAWLEAERLNLTAAVSLAVTAHPDIVLPMADALAGFLDRRHHIDDALTIARHVLATAQEAGDRYGEATALNHIGIALRRTRRFDEAAEAGIQAALIFQELGEHRDVGKAWTNLGLVRRETGRFQDAIDAHIEAVVIFQETGDRQSEGGAVDNLGAALREARRLKEAAGAHAMAAAIFRETGDRHGEGVALNNLSIVWRETGRVKKALDACTRAAALYQETGDRHGEASALSNLGLTLHDLRRFEEALDACTRAAALYQETGDRHGEAIALNNLGLTLRKMRRFEAAIDACARAAALFQKTGDLHNEGIALDNLDLAQRRARRRRRWRTVVQGKPAN